MLTINQYDWYYRFTIVLPFCIRQRRIQWHRPRVTMSYYVGCVFPGTSTWHLRQLLISKTKSCERMPLSCFRLHSSASASVLKADILCGTERIYHQESRLAAITNNVSLLGAVPIQSLVSCWRRVMFVNMFVSLFLCVQLMPRNPPAESICEAAWVMISMPWSSGFVSPLR